MDASSVVEEDERLQFYPKPGGAYEISDEALWQNTSLGRKLEDVVAEIDTVRTKTVAPFGPERTAPAGGTCYGARNQSGCFPLCTDSFW